MSAINMDKFDGSSEFLKLVVDNINDAVCWKDSHSIFQGCNQIFLDLMGVKDKDELIGKTDEYLFSESDAELFKEYNYLSFQDNKMRSIKKKITLRTGRSKTFLISIRPLINGSHKLVGTLWLFPEVYNQNVFQGQSHYQIDKLSIYLKNIIEFLPEYIYWKDKNFVYQGCNAKVSEFLGLASSELIAGKTDYDFGWSEQRIKELHDIDNTVISKGVTMAVEDIVPKDHDNKVFLTTKSPMRDENGKIIGVLGVSTDITELKETQKQLEKEKNKAEVASQAKSEFIANMSHDIRTPISGLQGMIKEIRYEAEQIKALSQQQEIATQEQLSQWLDKLFFVIDDSGGIAQEAVQELLSLCNEILDVVRLGSGLPEVIPEAFELRGLVNHNIGLLKPVAYDRKLKLTALIDQAVPAYLFGLRRYLDRILLNLTANSLKFTEEGQVTVRVSLKQAGEVGHSYQAGDRVTLLFQVEDTGIGIPADKFEVIFDHFSRLIPSYKGTYKGSGLGLYSVKQYVQAMEGKITVNSEEGEGSCFSVILPFIVSTAAAARAAKLEQEEGRAPQFIKKESLPAQTAPQEFKQDTVAEARILIAEDSHIAGRAALFELKKLSWAVDLVHSGEEAVQKAAEQSYDLIVMDIGLPGISGIEATRRIRALSDLKKAQVPIVAVTGHARENCYEDCVAAGMQKVMSKPIKPDNLISFLEQLKQSDSVSVTTSAASSNVPLNAQDQPIFTVEEC